MSEQDPTTATTNDPNVTNAEASEDSSGSEGNVERARSDARSALARRIAASIDGVALAQHTVGDARASSRLSTASARLPTPLLVRRGAMWAPAPSLVQAAAGALDAAAAERDALNAAARRAVNSAGPASAAAPRVVRAGSSHFGERASALDEDARRDLAALALRGQIMRDKFYGRASSGGSSKRFFQLGTVVEGRAEFFSSRLTKKQRKSSLAEELLADPEDRRDIRRRFDALQKTYIDSRTAFKKQHKRRHGTAGVKSNAKRGKRR